MTYSSPSISALITLAPLRLAPVGSTTEVSCGATEVGSRAAETGGALLVDDRSTVLAGVGNSRWGRGGLRGLGHVVALSIACLAAGSAVDGLVLDVVLGAAVTSRGAAAVEVAVGTNTGAAHTSLSTTTDIDLGDTGREGWVGLAGC